MSVIGYAMGIDEAGRGPVLGPLVYGTVYCRSDYKNQVKEVFKVKDSKQLTAKARSKIFQDLEAATEDISYFVNIVSADEISQKMLRRQKYSLNQISFDCAMSLIEQVMQDLAQRTANDTSGNRHVLREVYVDTVGKPAKYQAMLEEKFPTIDDIQVAAKADDLFPIVSASSIIAKVVRDRMVEAMSSADDDDDDDNDNDEENDVDGDEAMDGKSKKQKNTGDRSGGSVGTGYPGDKTTKQWLENNSDPVFGFDSRFVRFSWGTITKLLQNRDKFVSVDWSDDEDDEDDSQQTSLFSFAVSGRNTKLSEEQMDRSMKHRDDFYKSRGLSIVTRF